MEKSYKMVTKRGEDRPGFVGIVPKKTPPETGGGLTHSICGLLKRKG